MSSFELMQISDTHLSGARPQLVPNFEIAADIVAQRRPDLVIHTGDLAVEAPDRPDDLDFAHHAMNSLSAPWHAVPGNHDVGDNPDEGFSPARPVNSDWLSAYRRVFGPDRWTIRQSGWTLVGLNSLLFNSGLEEEAAQMDWLTEILDDTGGPVALFSHKPLFCETPDEEPVLRPFFVPAATRPSLAGLIARADIRLFACGHVHQGRELVHGGVRHVWAPPTSFVLPDHMQPRLGTKACGMVRYRFSPDALEVEFIYPDRLKSPPDEIVSELYAA